MPSTAPFARRRGCSTAPIGPGSSSRGSEAAEFLQGQLTNDVEALEPGAGCYAALLDRKGKVRADMRVLRLADDEFLIDTEPETRRPPAGPPGMYNVGRDAAVEADGAGDGRCCR